MIGKIYKLFVEGEEDIYIGSTCKSLKERLNNHKKNYRKYLNNEEKINYSFKLFEKYEIDNVKIALLEELEFVDKKELYNLESHYIKNNINCVNKNIPGRTVKQYRRDNKQILNDKNKLYYQINKDKINERQKTKHICICGGKFTYNHKLRHLTTIKHQTYIKSQQQPIINNITITNLTINN